MDGSMRSRKKAPGERNKLIKLLDGVIIGCFAAIVLILLFAKFCV